MSADPLKVVVSLGEALDKYSILEIKKQKISDPSRLENVVKEMEELLPVIKQFIGKYEYHYKCLLNINTEIWELSEKVRDPGVSQEDKNSMFLETFVKNDARYRVKCKLNELTGSVISEQKSYPASSVVVEALGTLDMYNEYSAYIQYLTLCYDRVIVLCNMELLVEVKKLYNGDPHIIVTNEDAPSDILRMDVLQQVEPIPNLFKKYDWKNTVKPLTYIMGGMVGDVYHCMYVIKCKYKQTGRKGVLYITDDRSFGGDRFSFPLSRTYEELKELVFAQDYIADFKLYQGEDISFDINLNDFRNYPGLYGSSWLELLANQFQFPITYAPWLTFDETWRDSTYEDTVVIHSALGKKLERFLPLLRDIINNNKCMFITCNMAEYDAFPLKHLVPLGFKETLKEFCIAINSCKFFIGNQSSPLAMAFAMNKPALGELISAPFYTRIHYNDFSWISEDNQKLDTLERFIVIPTLKENLRVLNMKFNGQFKDDFYISNFFPLGYVGTCIDIGMAEAVAGNNTYFFEEKGWQCICIEPNPQYAAAGAGVRKCVENVACGAEDKDDVVFEIYTVNGTNQGAISSLKPDARLINSHKHIINGVTKVPVKVRTLNTILAGHPEITSIDFISIDTEDTELDVLKGFDVAKWKPKLFVIENNFDEPYVADYLAQFGYKRVLRNAVNDFFTCT